MAAFHLIFLSVRGSCANESCVISYNNVEFLAELH